MDLIQEIQTYFDHLISCIISCAALAVTAM